MSDTSLKAVPSEQEKLTVSSPIPPEDSSVIPAGDWVLGMDVGRASQRLAVLTRHVAQGQGAPCGHIPAESEALESCNGLPNAELGSGAVICPSPTSSYERMHGRGSRAPAAWTSIPMVAGVQLKETLYKKADGEGIARVSVPSLARWATGVAAWEAGKGLHGVAASWEDRVNLIVPTLQRGQTCPMPSTSFPADQHQPPRATQCLHAPHRCAGVRALMHTSQSGCMPTSSVPRQMALLLSHGIRLHPPPMTLAQCTRWGCASVTHRTIQLSASSSSPVGTWRRLAPCMPFVSAWGGLEMRKS